MKEIRLLIGIPSGNMLHADMMMSLVAMIQDLYSQPLKNGKITSVGVNNPHGSVLAQVRENLANTAVEENWTHLLFIDSDQTFPRNMARWLLERDRSVVACNIATRALPANPTARLRYSKEPHYGRVLFTGRDDKGLQRVWRVGCGIMLIKTSVLRKIKSPRFPVVWNDAIKEYTGEDWGFCKKVEEAEIPIFVDQELSYHIGHIGQHVFNHETIENQRVIDALNNREAS